MQKRTFQIYRYDPDKDAKPYMQTVEIKLEGNERMLLDALMKLKAQDPTLAFRRSCREGVCGSDAMNINGKNGLACLTNMRTLKDPIVLKPLPGLPVVRDLIVDMTDFFKQYHSIKPYLVNDEHPAREGAPAVARGARRAQRPVRVHPVRELLHRPARASGGTRTSSSARPACCRPTASSPTAATRPPASASTTSRTRTACSAATRS